MADRVVMAAARIVLEPIFEADFLPASFGFRPRLSAHHALEAVRVAANRGGVWVLDADIQSRFDEISHQALVARVERRVSDRRMVKLLRGWLRAGVFEGGVVSAIEAGAPRGSPISPLLCNVALHAMDEAWAAAGQRPGALVRYCDDFVVLCASRQQAEQARRRAAAVLAELGLRLHPEKARIAHLERGAAGFDFLGFHRRMRESWKRRGRWYLNKWPSARAMASIRGKVPRADRPQPHRVAAGGRRRTARPRPARMGPVLPLRQLVAEVRCPRQLPQPAARDARQRQARTPRPRLDDPLHARLGLQPRRPSPDRDGAPLACACPTVNDVGEPCAGELHARFEAAAGGAAWISRRCRAILEAPPADPTDGHAGAGFGVRGRMFSGFAGR